MLMDRAWWESCMHVQEQEKHSDLAWNTEICHEKQKRFTQQG